MKILSTTAVGSLKDVSDELEVEVAKLMATSYVSTETVAQIKKSSAKLKNLLRDLYIRTDEQIAKELTSIHTMLDNMPYEQAKVFAIRTYNSQYFREEPDTDFKMQLVSMLLTFFHRDGIIVNGLWNEIANRSESVLDLL